MVQSELDHLRKIVRMMNSKTTSMDHILCMGIASKAWKSKGYQKGSSFSKLAVKKKNPCLKTVKTEGQV